MLSDNDREVIRAGAAAERLIGMPEWQAFEDGIHRLKESWTMQALAQGDTEFAKGCVAALAAVLASPKDTIEARKEILEREQQLRRDGYEDDEADEVEEEVSP